MSASNRKTIRDTMILQAEDIDYEIADLFEKTSREPKPEIAGGGVDTDF